MTAMKNRVSRNPGDYPNNGLSHPVQHLKDVINKIAFFPIEKQAEYADAICRAMVENHERMFEDAKNVEIEKLNANSVGNLAYVVMNSSSEVEVRNALDTLKLFEKHMFRKFKK